MSTSRYDLFTGYEDSNILQVNNYFTIQAQILYLSRHSKKKMEKKKTDGNSFKTFSLFRQIVQKLFHG